MSQPTTITIDNTLYVKATDAGEPTPMRIVVADRGWVFVGHAKEDHDGNITLTDAKVIRRWGTDAARPGLGWLAANGPTEKTQLEPSGTVRIPVGSAVASFDVTGGTWS